MTDKLIASIEAESAVIGALILIMTNLMRSQLYCALMIFMSQLIKYCLKVLAIY